MNKVQKIGHIKEIEEYLEKNHIYELFESLMRKLIVLQPEDPYQYIIDKLKKPDGKKIFIVGPPGSNVKDYTVSLSENFETLVVSTGDLLKNEVSKKTELGQKIEGFMKEMLYVPDDLVVSIVKQHLAEQDVGKDTIIEGFPKTIYQSMAM